MINIFRNFKKYWKIVIAIVCLLVIQAFCDLALPDYMSAIIDIGISNSGIEHEMPKYISMESYMMLPAMMNEDEAAKWNEAYGYSEEDGCFELKVTDEDTMREYDASFGEVIAVAYMISSGQFGDTGAMSANMPGFDIQNGVPAGILLPVREKIVSSMSSVGDTMFKSMAKRFVIDEYAKCGIDVNKIQKRYLWVTGAKMLAMALLVAGIAILIGFLASRVGAGIGKDLRGRIFEKVTYFSDEQMGRFSTASLITRTTNDVQQVQIVSIIILRMVLYSPILAIGGIINISHYKSGMSWIIVVAIAAVASLIMTLMIVAMPKFKQMQTKVDNVNLIAREILTGLFVIRAFSREKREEERFEEANKDLTDTMLFVNRAMAIMMPMMMLIMNGVSVLIVWTAAKKIDAGVLEVGAMTAFITYSMLIIMSFLMLTMVSIMLPRAGVAADRIQEILDTNDVLVEKENADRADIKDATVVFDNVSFKYPDGMENALEGISFTARAGQTTAIIGSTGCGKSTLIKLIPRFYDVTEGAITVDGRDIRDMALDTLRSQIGYVPQKGVLFSGDIRSNILFGAPNGDDDVMRQAADIAQATPFINEKEGQFDSFVAQGGTNVSGGQKQRLSIARAIARKPKIYLFDDSFSALDFKTDTELRKSLAKYTKDATVIIVAQRVSTILNADQIIVIDEGRMIGKGTHKELVKSCESYKEIAMSQLSEAEYNRSIEE